MPEKLLLGPLLSFVTEGTYMISFLMKPGTAAPFVILNGQQMQAGQAGETPSGMMWELRVSPAAGQQHTYSVQAGGETVSDANARAEWQFFVPAADAHPKICYMSCNGFSSLDLLRNTEHPYNLWEQLIGDHAHKEPFSLMIMGGDQVYADSIWSEIAWLKEWAQLKTADQLKRKSNPSLEQKLETFFETLYIERWNQPALSLALASIPSMMMWDDHDIFDGWGSYPEDLQNCRIYDAIFQKAKKYFDLFQIRNRPLLDNAKNHFGFVSKLGNFSFLALDHRSERTLKAVMSKGQWDAVIAWLRDVELQRNLVVLSAVPVVYRDFSFVESAVELTPWQEEVTDDLKDHWRAREHQGERLRLIHQLLGELRERTARGPANVTLGNGAPTNKWFRYDQPRTVLLSGDVHVGALGVITDSSAEPPVKIHQVIASGIVHPPPTMMEWAGIVATTNDDDEYLDDSRLIRSMMLAPVGSGKYIRARNFATLQEGTDGKLWVNWINESKRTAEYPMD